MNTTTALDVSTLPFERTFLCDDGTTIDMRKLVKDMATTVSTMADNGLIKQNDSFGFAMLEPLAYDQASERDRSDFYDNPEKYIWFVGGWGKERDYYIANAVRKLRALVRTNGVSTLDMRKNSPELFEDMVPGRDDNGDFPWGDFPWGGAVWLEMAGIVFMGAVSALTETEDDVVAGLLLGLTAKQIIAGNSIMPPTS